MPHAVPMFHVPDVQAAVDWYSRIGFNAVDTYGNDSDGLSFAVLAFGTSRIMLNQGGQPSSSFRREVDLYLYAENVDGIFESIKDRVDVIEGPHDTFYGMREVIIRDLNRFWITFGQPSTFASLINAVRRVDVEGVRNALRATDLKPVTLSAALSIASSPDYQNQGIATMLKDVGAVLPAEVQADVLRSYVGKYVGDKDFEINVTFEKGKLFASPGNHEPLSLMAIDQTTFTPESFDNYGLLVFNVQDGITTGCVLRHAGDEFQLRAVK